MTQLVDARSRGGLLLERIRLAAYSDSERVSSRSHRRFSRNLKKYKVKKMCCFRKNNNNNGREKTKLLNTKFSKFTKLELGPRKLSGDFFGLAPPDPLLSFDDDNAFSISVKSKGEPAPLDRPNGEAVARLVNRSNSSTSEVVVAIAPAAGDQGSLAEAAVRMGGCGLHGSAAVAANKSLKKLIQKKHTRHMKFM